MTPPPCPTPAPALALVAILIAVALVGWARDVDRCAADDPPAWCGE